MNIVSLFAGIGGFDLGLEKAGHQIVLQVENDADANAVLAARFPDVERHGDVTTLRDLPSGVDCVVGGFPCQDLSQAGRTAGIGGSKSSLVHEILRLVKKSRVEWIVIENVPNMLRLRGGEAMALITSALAGMGYRWAYRTIDAMAMGLPQRRERIFLVASRTYYPASALFSGNENPVLPVFDGALACGFYWTEGLKGLGWAVDALPPLKGGSGLGIPSTPAAWLPSDELIATPSIEDTEALQGFPREWTAAASPRSRWRLVGNAVAPPVAKWIGDAWYTSQLNLVVSKHTDVMGSKWSKHGVGDRRGSRIAIDATSWPMQATRVHLHEVMQSRKPLSARATGGFLSRAEKSSLRFPPKFLDAVREHLRRVD